MEQPPAQTEPLHKLRDWRKAKGWTLARCAEAVGTTKAVWHSWETGRHCPSRKFLPKVRDFTGGAVGAEDFFPSPAHAATRAAA